MSCRKEAQMFTKDDYMGYFNQLEDMLKQSIGIYTDLLNELNDNAIKSKLDPIATESMNSFRFIKKQKEKFV
jgi:hypothetical protein